MKFIQLPIAGLHQQLSHLKVLEKVASLQKHATENTWTDKHTKIYQTRDTISNAIHRGQNRKNILYYL
jgi:hypothetical protein